MTIIFKPLSFIISVAKKGVQGSHIDFLICAVAVRLSVEIYTTDKDFLNYQKHLPIQLYSGGIN